MTEAPTVKPWLFKQAEVTNIEWRYPAPFGTPIDALLDQHYWVHVAPRLTKGDIIRIFAEGDDYWLELLVIEKDEKFAKVYPLKRVEFTMDQLVNVPVPAGYQIKLRGPRKWSVLRGDEVLKEDMTKSQAEQWLTDHVKASPKAA